jgi:hypothetical protein
MSLGLGAVPSVWHLTSDDLGVCALPLVRQYTLGHQLVSHWTELSSALAAQLRREVSSIEPSENAWLDTTPRCPLSESSGMGDRYVVLAYAESNPDENLVPDPFRVVPLDETTLASGRVDAVVESASAVIIACDAGDLAVVAARCGVPVLLTSGSPGAAWIVTSSFGEVFTGPSGIRSALGQLVDKETQRTRGDSPARRLVPVHSWARWYESQV